jgi:hypothetical protein
MLVLHHHERRENSQDASVGSLESTKRIRSKPLFRSGTSLTILKAVEQPPRHGGFNNKHTKALVRTDITQKTRNNVTDSNATSMEFGNNQAHIKAYRRDTRNWT